MLIPLDEMLEPSNENGHGSPDGKPDVVQDDVTGCGGQEARVSGHRASVELHDRESRGGHTVSMTSAPAVTVLCVATVIVAQAPGPPVARA